MCLPVTLTRTHVGTAGRTAPTRNGSGAGHLPLLEGLDDVLDLDVVVRPEADTALEAFADLGDVLLEPTQRLDTQVVGDDDTVPNQPCPAVAVDGAGAHDAAGDVADARNAEDLAHLGGTELHLFVDRLEHALEGCLDVLDRLVDDRVVADLDTLTLGQLRRLALRPDIEADDDRLG